MASDGGGKFKPKRNQHSNKPYERKSSLLGKLKNSVKDLFVPSWLSWNSDKEPPARDVRHGETLSSDCVVQNRHNVQGSSTLSTQNSIGQGLPRLSGMETFSARENTVSASMQPGGFQSDGPSPNVTIGSPETHSLSRGTNLSGSAPTAQQCVPHDKPEVPGSSFLAFQSDINDLPDQTPVRPIMVSTTSFGRSPVTSKTDSEKKLWTPEYGRRGKPLVPPAKDKPAFNSSLLFGNLSKNDTFSIGDSSFYSGKTRFGGASAERKRPLNQSLPYQSSLPLRKQVRVNKRDAHQATTSATAQRILETLDKMSTPLGDAKKIPRMDTSNDSILSFTPSSYRRASLLGTSVRSATRPLQLPSRGPPTSQYQAASQAAIAKNRYQPAGGDSSMSRSTAQTEKAPGLLISQEAPQIAPSRNVSERVGPPPAVASSGKMKTKRFSQHISSNVTDQAEVVEVPNLRTDFTLPLDKLTSIPLQTASALPGKAHTVAYSSIPSSTCPTEASPLKFTFSTPIKEKQRPMSSPYTGSPDPDFTFSSPIQAEGAKTSAAGAEEGSKSSPEPAVGASSIAGLGTSSAAFSPLPVPVWGSTAPKPKVSSPDIGGTSSSFKSYTKWGSKNDNSAAADVPGSMFSLGPAASLKSGSVMDILGKNSAPLLSSTSPKESTSGGKESSETPSPTVPSTQTDDLMAKFLNPKGSWECDTCMVVNKADANRCVACETPKPGAKMSAPATSVSDKPSLSELFKTPQGNWECDTCMVQNTADATKCVACETPKPGQRQQQTTSASSGSSNSVPLSELFKKPAGNWECDTCMVQNTGSSVRCVACDSPKPGLQSAGIVSKAPEPSSAAVISVSPTGGFTISTPAISATTTGSAGFKFGSTDLTTTSTSASGGFQFGATSTGTAPSGGFQFGAPSARSETSSTVSSGFKFGSSETSESVSTTASTGGFKFVTSSVSSGSSAPTGGFKFGTTSSNSSAETSVGSTAASGGFVFGSSGGKSNTTSSGAGSSTLYSQASSVQPPSSVISSVGKSETTSSASFGSAPSVFSSQGSTGQTPNNIVPNVSNPFPAPQKKLFNAPSPFTESTAPCDSGKEPKVQQTVLSTSQNGAVPTLTSKTDTSSLGSSSLFTFGAPVSSVNSGGLGLGNSLMTAAPIVNGVMSSSQFQPAKDGSNPAPLFSQSMPAPAFGGFGQTAAQNGPTVLQGSSRKLLADSSDMGAPSAKKSLGASTEAPANGLFSFGGSSSSTSSFGPASTFPFAQQASGNGPVGSTAPPAFGFSASFGQANSTPQQAAPNMGFNFSAKPRDSGIGNGPSKEPLAFNATPSFNFAGAAAQPSSGTPFQFGAKSAESATPSGGLFQFGGSSTPMMPVAPSATTTASFPAPAGGAIGNFSLGVSSNDSSGRKMKRAVRRLKK